MPVCDKICLTTDFSHSAEAAVPYAVTLAKNFKATISLVHVFDGTSLFDAAEEAGEGEFPNPAHWIDPLFPRLEARLTALAAEYSSRNNVSFIPVLLKGSTIKEIVKFLKNEKMGYLVIATHGRTGLNHALFGSVADRLVRSSPCPVLIVRPELTGVAEDGHTQF